MNAILSRLALLAGAVLLAATPLSASVARVVPFEEKVGTADAIVVGKVVSSTSRWDSSGRWIVTDSVLEVEKALKGTPTSRLSVVTPGGTVNGVRQETIGVPAFRLGDEHVVFVRESAVGSTVAFLDQGVYDVERDSLGRATVRRAPSRLILVDQRSGKAALAEEGSPVSLDAFEGEVRAVAEKTADYQLTDTARGTVKPLPGSGPLHEFVRGNRTVLTIVGIGLLLALIPLIIRAIR